MSELQEDGSILFDPIKHDIRVEPFELPQPCTFYILNGKVFSMKDLAILKIKEMPFF